MQNYLISWAFLENKTFGRVVSIILKRCKGESSTLFLLARDMPHHPFSLISLLHQTSIFFVSLFLFPLFFFLYSSLLVLGPAIPSSLTKSISLSNEEIKHLTLKFQLQSWWVSNRAVTSLIWLVFFYLANRNQNFQFVKVSTKLDRNS